MSERKDLYPGIWVDADNTLHLDCAAFRAYCGAIAQEVTDEALERMLVGIIQETWPGAHVDVVYGESLN